MNLRAKVGKELRRRVVKNFLDVLILSKLENSEPMGGYDFYFCDEQNSIVSRLSELEFLFI